MEKCKQNLLFLCTGNTCRSPMAEYLCRDALEKQGKAERFECKSAGLYADPTERVAANAVAALRRLQIDLPADRLAVPLTRALLEWADALYVMTESHRAALLHACPDLQTPIRVLGVSDPYGGDLHRYLACCEELQRAVNNIVGEE